MNSNWFITLRSLLIMHKFNIITQNVPPTFASVLISFHKRGINPFNGWGVGLSFLLRNYCDWFCKVFQTRAWRLKLSPNRTLLILVNFSLVTGVCLLWIICAPPPWTSYSLELCTVFVSLYLVSKKFLVLGIGKFSALLSDYGKVIFKNVLCCRTKFHY